MRRVAKAQIGRSTKCERVDVTTLIANSIAPLAPPGPGSVLRVVEPMQDEEGERGAASGQEECLLELGVCRAGSEATMGAVERPGFPLSSPWRGDAGHCCEKGPFPPAQCQSTDCRDSVIPRVELANRERAPHEIGVCEQRKKNSVN
jgi:hypothetical protein